VFGSIVAGTAVVSIVITALLLLLIIRCRSPASLLVSLLRLLSTHSVQLINTLAAPITDGVKHRFDVCLSVCLSVYYVPAAVQQQLVLIKKNSRM